MARVSAAPVRALRVLPLAGIGFAAAAGAIALSAAPLKFAVVGLAAAFGGVGALIVGRLYRLTPLLLVALAVGLTVKLDVSFLQHFEAVGQYLPSIGGGAGLTVSVALLVAAALIVAKLTGLGEASPGPAPRPAPRPDAVLLPGRGAALALQRHRHGLSLVRHVALRRPAPGLGRGLEPVRVRHPDPRAGDLRPLPRPDRGGGPAIHLGLGTGPLGARRGTDRRGEHQLLGPAPRRRTEGSPEYPRLLLRVRLAARPGAGAVARAAPPAPRGRRGRRLGPGRRGPDPVARVLADLPGLGRPPDPAGLPRPPVLPDEPDRLRPAGDRRRRRGALRRPADLGAAHRRRRRLGRPARPAERGGPGAVRAVPDLRRRTQQLRQPVRGPR